MMLSPHFTLEEATVSQAAARAGLENQPDEATLARMKRTAMGMEVVRSRLGGMPIMVTSWLRTLPVNRLVGSKDSSQHILGEAVDFVCPRFGNPAKVYDELRQSTVVYDQLILEFAEHGGGWVHISFTPTARRQALVIDTKGVRVWTA